MSYFISPPSDRFVRVKEHRAQLCPDVYHFLDIKFRQFFTTVSVKREGTNRAAVRCHEINLCHGLFGQARNLMKVCNNTIKERWIDSRR